MYEYDVITCNFIIMKCFWAEFFAQLHFSRMFFISFQTDHNNPRDGRGHVSLADRGGDILSEEDSKSSTKSDGPMFKIYKWLASSRKVNVSLIVL